MKTIRYLFPEGCPKAVTLSYDDGVVDDRRLVELLNTHGMKGTFHINAGLLGGGNRIAPEEVRTLYAGHEVSCHSYTHPFLERSPAIAALNQILEDRKALEALVGHPVRGMSYPFGTYNPSVLATLRAADIVYCRTTLPTRQFGLPNDWLEWHPTCHHNHNLKEITDQFLNSRHTFALLYVWGHAYEFDRDGNWEVIDTFCLTMGGKKEVWKAANIEIVDYVTALRRLEFTADNSQVYNPSVLPVWLQSDNEVVRVAPGGLQSL